MRTFQCSECGGTFDSPNTDAEANAEAEQLWGVPSASTHPEMVIVCEDCFRAILYPEHRKTVSFLAVLTPDERRRWLEFVRGDQ